MNQMEKVANMKLLPGQKFPTPTRGFGDRVFYESLLRQRPESIMAQEWCVYHGVLDKEEAEKLHNQILKRKGKSNNGSSYIAPAPASPERVIKKKKKRIVEDEDVAYDAEMNAAGNEGIGISAI